MATAELRTGDPVAHLWGIRLSLLAERTLACLRRDGITTIGDLLQRDYRDLTDLRRFGGASLEEVRRVLAGQGLALKGEEVADGR